MKSNENNSTYFFFFFWKNGKEEQMNFVSGLFAQASYGSFRSFVHHIVRDVKLDPQEILFVLYL